jgi:hypothetical protein
MLFLVPFILGAGLGVYLVFRDLRYDHPATAGTRAAVAPSARQRRRAARGATDPNEAARLSGSWG